MSWNLSAMKQLDETWCIVSKMKILKGIVLYKFDKPEQVFEKEIKIARNIFDTNNIKYSMIETIDERYGFGISFIIEKRK